MFCELPLKQTAAAACGVLAVVIVGVAVHGLRAISIAPLGSFSLLLNSAMPVPVGPVVVFKAHAIPIPISGPEGACVTLNICASDAGDVAAHPLAVRSSPTIPSITTAAFAVAVVIPVAL